MRNVLKKIFVAALAGVAGLMPAAESVTISPLALNGDPSFEQSQGGWNVPPWFSAATAVQPQFDDSTAAQGKRSVRFDLEPGKTLLFWQSFALHPGIERYRVAGWMKKAEVRGVTPDIRLEMVSKGTDGKEKYQYCVAQPTGRTANGFAEYAAVAPVAPGTFAVRLQLFAPRGGVGTSGRVWFDAVTLSKASDSGGKLVLELVRPGGDHGVYVRGEAQKISVVATNNTDQTQNAEITMTLRDHTGKLLHDDRRRQSLSPGETAEIFSTIDPGLNDCGFYHIEGSIQAPGMLASRSYGALVITENRARRDPFFGFTGYGAPDSILTAMAKLGAGTCGYIVYVSSQNPQGVFQFERYTAPLALRRQLGYRIVAGYNIQGSDHVRMPWLNAIARRDLESGAANYSEEYFASYRDFARAIGGYLRDKADEISLIEEIDIAQHLTRFEHDSYIRIVRESARELKKSAPELPVSSIGVASPDFNANPPLAAMKHFWKELSGELDAIGFDGYITPNCFGEGRTAGTPESNRYREKLVEIAKLSRDAGKQYFSMEEAGWSMVSTTPLSSRAWLDYAAILERTLILSKSVPEMKHYLYFKVTDGQRLEDWNIFIGQGTVPTAGAAAFGVVAHNLAFAVNPEPVILHQELHIYLFDQDGKTLSTLWSTAPGGTRFRLTLPDDTELSDFMGKRRMLPAGPTDLELTGEPLYLWSGAGRDAVRQALRGAAFSLPEIQIDAFRSGRDAVTVALLNLTDRPQHAAVTIAERQQTVALKARELQLTVLSGVDCSRPETPIAVHTANHAYTLKKALRAIAISGETPRDGIRLSGEETLYPVDALANHLWTGPDDLSAEIRMHYDRENLYLEVNVRDDVRIRERTGARLWGSDAIQFAVNPGGDALSPALTGKPGYGPGDWEFGMALTPEGPQLYCYHAPPGNPLSGKLVPPEQIHYSIADRDAETTCYQVALPWALLGMKGESGALFGFNLIALDADRAGQSSNYWMGLSAGIANGKQPDCFRKFILE